MYNYAVIGLFYDNYNAIMPCALCILVCMYLCTHVYIHATPEANFLLDRHFHFERRFSHLVHGSLHYQSRLVRPRIYGNKAEPYRPSLFHSHLPCRSISLHQRRDNRPLPHTALPAAPSLKPGPHRPLPHTAHPAASSLKPGPHRPL